MKFRYVVIDDAAFIRELLKGVCNNLGGICVGENDGDPRAVSLVRQTWPDIVFLDLVLPGRNGIEIAAEIRKVSPETKILACTSIDQESILQRALSEGIDAILKKPFTKDSVLSVLTKQLTPKGEVAT